MTEVMLRPSVSPLSIATGRLDASVSSGGDSEQLPPGPNPDAQTGSLYADNANPAERWRLPAFALSPDPDPSFAFAALLAGVDSSGNPTFSLVLSFSLIEIIQPDAAAFNAANPESPCQLIPLNALSAAIVFPVIDSISGTTSQISIPAQFERRNDGSWLVSSSPLIGVNVRVVYQILLLTGGATVGLAANWIGYRTFWAIAPDPIPDPDPGAFPGEIRPSHPSSPSLPRRPIDPVKRIRRTTLSGQPFELNLALATKYAAGGYRTAFTITEAGQTRQITGLDDLKTAHPATTEYAPLVALGDPGFKYPSVTRIFLGSVSRTLVCIPAAYVLARGTKGCGAVCYAALDPDSEQPDASKFEFSFALRPELSEIDLAAITRDAAAHPEIADCKIVTANLLAAPVSVSLVSAVASNVSAAAGDDPMGLTLNLQCLATGPSASAVVNANLFIAEIGRMRPPYLSGALTGALDASGQTSFSSAVIVSFARTAPAAQGGDGFAIVDNDAGGWRAQNSGVLTLRLSRAGRGAAIASFDLPIAEGQKIDLPGVAPPSPGDYVSERRLDLPPNLTKTDLTQLIAFQTQDVRNARLPIGVNSASVAFAARGISAIQITPRLNAQPDMAIPALQVTQSAPVAQTSILLPIEYVLLDLSGALDLSISFSEVEKPTIHRTINADFGSQPIVVIYDSEIDAAVPP